VYTTICRAETDRYLREHATVSGHPISIPDAITIGELVFGSLLKQS
jgi:hypothetical protein